MKIAFVGVKRKYAELPAGYIDHFIRFHLEIPYYYARDGGNDVTVVTVDHSDRSPKKFDGHPNGSIRCITEEEYKASDEAYDVVFHWRSFFNDLWKPGVNLMLSQDHTYGPDWLSTVRSALSSDRLNGILVFRTWHKRNMEKELGGFGDRLFTDTTFGVDTDIYKPTADKDPYQMLWSSDPGRGFDSAIGVAVKLFQKDKRFRLHLCYPDYVRKPSHTQHPALVWHGCVQNGQKLWDLFNTTGVLPYTSTFMEPSSRVHRQAQSAGSLVLYPPNMGTPSEVIEDGVTGIVSPTFTWPDRIFSLVKSGEWLEIGKKARDFAVTQNWQTQAENFNALVKKINEERK